MEELYKLLDSVEDSTGDFACSGLLPELGLPGLAIENVGDISLPVQDEQAQKIIEVAKKGDKTVRKTWQLDPCQITIKNEDFIAGVNDVVSAVKQHLGCNEKAVEANLNKVLLYEKGGYVKAHQDNVEKDSGMFAIMAIQLPSKFEGGKITIRHAGDEKVIEMDEDRSAYCCKYAAHYSDCKHEMSEITSGYRLALVYSLCWTASGDPPSADTGPGIIRKIAKTLPEMYTDDRNLFCWFFSHKYQESDLCATEDTWESQLCKLGVNALKGDDKAVAQALQQANKLLPEDEQFEFYIAEVTREHRQFGDFYGEEFLGSHRFEPNDEEEEELHFDHWCDFDGMPTDIEVVRRIWLDVENDVVNFQRGCSVEGATRVLWGEADSDENTGPDEEEGGAIETHWYSKYAILGWQKDDELNLRCKLNGYDAVVTWVSTGLEYANRRKEDPCSTRYQNMVSRLKSVIDHGMSNSKNALLGTFTIHTMLKTLTNLRTDHEAVMLANLFISNVMGKSVETESSDSNYRDDGGIGEPLVDLILALGWPSLSQSLKKLLDGSPVSRHGYWANVLKALLEKNVKKDDCFEAMLASLVEKVQADAQNNLLESVRRRTKSQSKKKLQDEDNAAENEESRVEAIASLVFSINDADLFAKFTNSIQTHCQKSPKSSLLQNLIKYLEKKKLSNNLFCIQLLKLRINQLEEVERAGVPPFTWKQDDAMIYQHPQVQAFLRGPKKTMKYAFKSIVEARRFVSSYFGAMPSWGRPARFTLPHLISRSYTATATATGVGQNVYVLIEKTRKWYDERIAPITQQLEELKKLRSMVNQRSSSAQLEPQAKRRAIQLT